MTRDGYGAALQQFRTLFSVGSTTGLTDGQLLERFKTRHDEAAESAFAALVERHGPMVFRACRNILRNEHEAQDAFQATFLILVRKADDLWVRDSVGPWLHRVACRVAVRAKIEAGRRKVTESRAAESKEGPSICVRSDQLSEALHEEIDRLPQLYRALVVLCDLEGRSYDEAARQLGCPIGTVKSRLARGRDLLRRRLRKRGAAVGENALGAGLALQQNASVSVPRGLATDTVHAALGLAAGAGRGVIPTSIVILVEAGVKAMIISKLKLTLMVLASIGMASAGVAVLAQQGKETVRRVSQESQAAPSVPPGRQSEIASSSETAGNQEAAPAVQDLERRLKDLEQKVKNLPAQAARRGGTRKPGEPFLNLEQMNEEDKKSQIWDVLTFGRFVGQFDLADITPKEMILQLSRMYYGGSPSTEEFAELSSIFNADSDREMTPEAIVRELLQSETFRTSSLAATILHKGRAPRERGQQ